METEKRKLLGIIPAAGHGVRFGELSKRYPKSVLPYKNKPIICWNIELLIANKVDEIRIVTSFETHTAIKEAVEFYDYPIKISILQMPCSFGPGHSVAHGIQGDHNAKALVILSDLVLGRQAIYPSVESKSLLAHFELPEDRSWIGIEPALAPLSRWCLIGHLDGKVKYIEDKVACPSATECANGIYYFHDVSHFASIVERWEDPRSNLSMFELQISHLFELLMADLYVKHLKVLPLGTLQEYLQNRGVSSSRSFNSVVVGSDSVTKTTTADPNKLHREFAWFGTVGARNFRSSIPQVYEEVDSGYVMERINTPTLKELFVFASNDRKLWDRIFIRMFSLLRGRTKNGKNSLFTAVVDKVKLRVDASELLGLFRVGEAAGFVGKFAAALRKTPMPQVESHGDMVFSNIMFDPSTEQVRLIDPNGDRYFHGLYDEAKLYQSAIFLYDLVDAELYIDSDIRGTKLYGAGKSEIQKSFMEAVVTQNPEWNDETFELLHQMACSHLLSLLPLHQHNRTNQELFLRFYKNASKFTFVQVRAMIEAGTWISELTKK